MADNMTIGPALSIGGNTVQVTQKGKIQVTNARGKVKTLSQDQFKKQLIKNADNIEAGRDFEFKKDHKVAKIVGLGVATAAAVTGVIYRKDIAKYAKDFTWAKFKKDIKSLFSKIKKDNKKPESSFTQSNRLGIEYENEAHRNYVFSDAVDTINLDVKTREQLKKDAEKAFEKESEELIPHKYVKRDKEGTPIGIMNKTERKAFDRAQKRATEAEPATPKPVKTKVDPKMRAKWLKAHPELAGTKSKKK